MSRCSAASLLLLLAVLCALVVRADPDDLDLKRVHVIDYLPTSRAFLFRGNRPIVGNNFAYDKLLSYMGQRAKEEANATLPPPNRTFLIDITLQNEAEVDYWIEKKFWDDSANNAKGKLIDMILLGAIAPPADFKPDEQTKLINDGVVWMIDKLPHRLIEVRRMLEAGPPAGYSALAVYAHCHYGCDRTGEFVAGYRMTYKYAPTLLQTYVRDTVECGRSPNYFLSGMIGWYCLTWNLWNSTTSHPPLPDCLTAYKCALFGKCTPSH